MTYSSPILFQGACLQSPFPPCKKNLVAGSHIKRFPRQYVTFLSGFGRYELLTSSFIRINPSFGVKLSGIFIFDIVSHWCFSATEHKLCHCSMYTRCCSLLLGSMYFFSLPTVPCIPGVAEHLTNVQVEGGARH